jgi:cell wall-associated NlpC family hydrolase
MRVPSVRSLRLAILLLPAGTSAVAAQQTRFTAGYGLWFPAGDSTTHVFAAGIAQPVLGPLGVGVELVHVAATRSATSRTLTGGELTVRLGGWQRGFYAVAGTGLGFRHASGNPDAFWSLGAGVGVRLFSSVVLDLEGRYRVEDAGVAGFWSVRPEDRKGVYALARLSFRVPGVGAGPAAPSAGSADPWRPPADPPADARAAGASADAARLTASVVETALAVMGAPYRWGGTDQNGFDCSGLIQYAYAQHGVVLPRMSRDQMRMGGAVDRRPEALRPGDVLGFSAERSSQITHVGLYVGDGRFIHSASTGVRLTRLEAGDPDSRWWRDRWVGARRIIE